MSTRRQFVATAVTAASYARIAGANSRVRLGLIGCGGRGRYVGSFMRDSGNADFIAFADTWLSNAKSARELMSKGQGEVYQDFRRLLDNKDVDAVLVATPDHWHSRCTISAIKAGKNVYSEKPISYTIKEGRAMVTTANEHPKLIVTAGTQQRSAPHFPDIAKLIASGELGEVRYVRVWNFTNLTPYGIGHEADSPTPADNDWDMYCGPAPLHAYNGLRQGPTFRWYWDYANGTITDFGTHRFDTVHQIMGVDARQQPGPKSISAYGGRYSLKDDGQMPDLLQVSYDYGDFIMSYEACNMSGHGLGGRHPDMRYYGTRSEFDRPHGMAFYGTNGAVFADRVGYEVFPDPKGMPLKRTADPSLGTSSGLFETSKEFRIEKRQRNVRDATSTHAQAFVAAVRDGAPNPAPLEGGHRATSVALLGVIAYKTGEKLHWDAAQETFTNSNAANQLLDRPGRAPWDRIG